MSEIADLLRGCAADARGFAAAGLKLTDKAQGAGRVDVVTQADLAVDHRIREALQRLEPGVPVVSEELGGAEHAGGDCWVLDPIDGTHNFAAGLDHWAISLARMSGDEVVEGWILGPGDVLLHGRRGGAATANGDVIRVTDRASAWSLLSVNLSPAVVPLIMASNRFAGVRVFGSHCLGLAWSATGWFGLHAGRGHAWDVAAGYGVLACAGGRVVDFEGNPRSVWRRAPALAGAPQIVDEALAVLRDAASLD